MRVCVCVCVCVCLRLSHALVVVARFTVKKAQLDETSNIIGGGFGTGALLKASADALTVLKVAAMAKPAINPVTVTARCSRADIKQGSIRTEVS